MKITKRQLRRIIKEEINRLSEAPDIASLTGPGAPLVVKSYIDNMMKVRTSSTALGLMVTLWNAMLEAPGDIASARSMAGELGLSPALASFHARKISKSETYPTGEELRAAVEAVGPTGPPAPRPPKPYGGGTRNRPYDRST